MSTWATSLAAVVAEVALEVAALHAAMVSCSGSLLSAAPSVECSGLSMRRSASMTFARASSRVWPWLLLRAPRGCWR